MFAIDERNVLKLMLIYALLTALLALTGLSIIQFLIFGITTTFVLFTTSYSFYNSNRLDSTIIIFGYLLYATLIFNVMFTGVNISFLIKYIGIFSIFCFGVLVHKSNSIDIRNVTVAICFTPFIYSLIELMTKGHITSAFFTNRNNAVLYGIITCGLFYRSTKNVKLFAALLVSNIIIYKTMGALVGMLLSSLFLIFKGLSSKKIITLVALIIPTSLVSISILYTLDLEITHRIHEVIMTIDIMRSMTGSEIVNTSYADMAYMSGSQEQSMLFRLKHWTEIIQLYFKRDLINMIIGSGMDSVHVLSSSGLRAHNDYIRLLFENGALFLIVFILLNIYILRNVGINIFTVPFLTVLIYFCSENLIDNFLAMSLLYFNLGVMFDESRKGVTCK